MWVNFDLSMLNKFSFMERKIVYSTKRGIEIARFVGNEIISDSGARLTERITHIMPLPPNPKLDNEPIDYDRCYCTECGNELELVRPWKYQCGYCERLEGK